MYLVLLEFYRVLPYCLFQLSSAPADSIDFDILIMNSVSFANIGACHDPYGFLPNYRGFYWFLLDFTGFYCFFFYCCLLFFSGLNWVFAWYFLGSYGVLTEFYWVLLTFYFVLMCITGLYRVLLGFTGFY